MRNALSDLQSWHAAQCDGEWEHCFGIKIITLDNPGWSLIVELEETLLGDKIFVESKVEIDENTWSQCFVKDKKFTGYCGPNQLEELIATFINWAKSEPDWLSVQYATEAEIQERKDNELWAALGEEIGSAECRKELCSRKHIQFSAFCRKHHFEMVRGFCLLKPIDYSASTCR